MRRKFRLFNICNYTFLILIALTAIYPFIYMLTISLIPPGDYLKCGFVLFPDRISLDAYKRIFENGSILLSYRSTLIITVGGVAINLFLTVICAYVMSKTDLKGYRFFINLIIFTMYFKGGLIPSYMLMRNLGLTDRYLSVMLTGAISTYHMLVLRSFFLNIPESLEEAAIIDGASEPYVLFKIIIPVSLPAISTIGLFYAVGHWNSYYIPMIYLNSREKWPLQVILREILFESTESLRTTGDIGQVHESAIGPQLKMAMVIITVFPILCIYPLLQKYFIKGVLIGAVKA